MGYMGDVKTKTFIDDNASSATYVAAAATSLSTSTFTLAATSFGTNTGRKITATTSGTGDNGLNIVGTDVNGDALTEVTLQDLQNQPLQLWNYSIFSDNHICNCKCTCQQLTYL